MSNVLEDKQKKTNIGHRARAKQKLMQSSVEALLDYEILELLLFLAIPRIDVKPIAKRLLEEYGSLGKILSINPILLKQNEGVNDNVASVLRLVKEIAHRVTKEEMIKRPILESWWAVLDYCRASMGNSAVENYRVIFLNKKNMVISDHLHESGTVDQIHIYPREIIKRCLLLDASSIILVHNHPSGNTKPSPNDIKFTKDLVDIASLFDIKILDHIIISSTSHYSFKNNGVI